jgi:hypothetical protein
VKFSISLNVEHRSSILSDAGFLDLYLSSVHFIGMIASIGLPLLSTAVP